MTGTRILVGGWLKRLKCLCTAPLCKLGRPKSLNSKHFSQSHFLKKKGVEIVFFCKKIVMFDYLKSGRVNLQLFQEFLCKKLLDFLEKIDDTKALFWDEQLLSKAYLIATNKQLEERNVKKNILLSKGNLPFLDVKNAIFITRADLNQFEIIADHIMTLKKSKTNASMEFHIIFISRKSTLCERHLKNKGVFGSIQKFHEMKCDLFPLDKDILSMENPNFLHDLLVENDETSLFQAACSLVIFQSLFGRIPTVFGKGKFSKKIWDYAKQLAIEDKSLFYLEKGAVDQMIILDRSIDYMSTLVTQLTYDGLIDEIFKINQNKVLVDIPDKKSSGNDFLEDISTPEKKKIILNSSDEIYNELRDKHFNEVGKVLSKNAKIISETFEERHNAKTVQNMKIFASKLPGVMDKKTLVEIHSSIAEIIKEFTETDKFSDDLAVEQDFLICSELDKPNEYILDLITKEDDFFNIMRLICIQCVAGSGLKSKVLETYKREIIHAFGIEVILHVNNLEKAGLLYLQGDNRSYNVLRKTFNLTVDDFQEVAPTDISYVHSFYAPLSIRIIENSLKPQGWQSITNSLNYLPGPSFKDFQAPLTGNRRSSFSSELSALECPRCILVFFVGGCTLAEISALRFLQKQEDNNVEFVIVTTNIINKNTVIKNI
ncbi:VPS33A family protein [Megaselia abdita]